MTGLPAESGRWSEQERALGLAVLAGQAVVVNVRRNGPHRRLVDWLREVGLITYVGHAGRRHAWPESDFANPFFREATVDRERMVRRYREWLSGQPELWARLHGGELSGQALGCWCAPLPCHADVLVEEVNRIDVRRRPR
jgi:Domain of unknown function (DUF4326)